MITFSIVKDSILDAGKRILKIVEFGPKTTKECAPFGEDSAPLKDMVAIHARTTESGESVVIGYINKDQLANPGEKRMYSLKPDGSLSFDIYLKNDGTVEIGGNGHHLVKYAPLNTALTDQDTAINTELGKIALAIGSLGGTYTPATVATDISASRAENVKTG
ncbi:hypothetical protein C7967_11553 [Thalassospira sp. 11-3]|nr:hypothetical protein C7967_11553 [Thalassospira sp. 11-3]